MDCNTARCTQGRAKKSYCLATLIVWRSIVSKRLGFQADKCKEQQTMKIGNEAFVGDTHQRVRPGIINKLVAAARSSFSKEDDHDTTQQHDHHDFGATTCPIEECFSIWSTSPDSSSEDTNIHGEKKCTRNRSNLDSITKYEFQNHPLNVQDNLPHKWYLAKACLHSCDEQCEDFPSITPRIQKTDSLHRPRQL